MKKIIIVALLIVSNLLANNVTAQERVKINIASQPGWGPTGYDYVDYYYLPEIESYYSVPKHQYVYPNNGKWIFSNNLPPAYKTYNVYNGPKVVINEPTPYLRFNDHRAKYKGWNDRPVIIRDSKEEKYRNHWNNGKHKGWYKDKNKPNGNGKKVKKAHDDNRDGQKMKKKDRDDDNDGKKMKKKDYDDNDNKGKNKGNGNGNGKKNKN